MKHVSDVINVKIDSTSFYLPSSVFVKWSILTIRAEQSVNDTKPILESPKIKEININVTHKTASVVHVYTNLK